MGHPGVRCRFFCGGGRADLSAGAHSGLARRAQALRDLPTTALAVGGALALLSHFTYGSFDWVGRHCSGHRLARTTTLAIAMTSYPFTLNLGSLIGGVGVRYRLYDRRGVDPGTIGQVVGTSIVTN